jgi:hypothetical protein
MRNSNLLSRMTKGYERNIIKNSILVVVTPWSLVEVYWRFSASCSTFYQTA